MGAFRILILVWCSVLLSLLSEADPLPRIWEFLGTKSPYPHASAPDQADTVENCWLKQLHLVRQVSISYKSPLTQSEKLKFSRHGTRNPTAEDIQEFIQLEVFLQSNQPALASQLPWTRNWTNPFKMSDASLLVERGQNDLYRLAKRLQRRYPNQFLNASFHPQYFEFKSSEKSRASQSASSFAIGLFEHSGTLGNARQQPIALSTMPRQLDKEISPHDACPAYKNQPQLEAFVRHQLGALRERYLDPLYNRLNSFYSFETPISRDLIRAALQLCTFEASLLGQLEHSCGLFSEEDLAMYEYEEDLIDYWSLGPGNSWAASIACAGLTSTISKLTSDALGTFKFGHKATVTLLASLLGIYKKPSTHLFANASIADIQRRAFRMSQISPFAANIQLEIWECPISAQVNDDQLIFGETSIFIRGRLNEQIVPIAGCGVLCSWKSFSELFNEALRCDWESLCQDRDLN